VVPVAAGVGATTVLIKEVTADPMAAFGAIIALKTLSKNQFHNETNLDPNETNLALNDDQKNGKITQTDQ